MRFENRHQLAVWTQSDMGQGVDSEFGRVHQAMSAELACASVADRIWCLVTSFTQATPQPVSRHTA